MRTGFPTVFNLFWDFVIYHFIIHLSYLYLEAYTIQCRHIFIYLLIYFHTYILIYLYTYIFTQLHTYPYLRTLHTYVPTYLRI